MKIGVSKKMTPIRLKFFAVITIAEPEHQPIKLAGHTHVQWQRHQVGAKDDVGLSR